MAAITPSTVGATYVEPSATEVLQPGLKLGDLLHRNMTQPYVLQRLSERSWYLTVELHGFEWAAHSDDHSAWLLLEDRIIHSPDLINPDQPPFWKFAGNERFRFHEDNLRQIYDLGWDHLSGSHGNLGTRDDIDFELAFLVDMKAAIGDAMAAHPFGDFVDPTTDAHTSFLSNFFGTIATETVDALRPKYGQLYGFEYATKPNAEMVAWTLFEYR